MEDNKCPVCSSKASISVDYDLCSSFVVCPVCGRFELFPYVMEDINYNHLASYLAYHAFYNRSHLDSEYRYNTFLSKEKCDSYNKEFEDGNYTYGRPVHIDNDIIENWYPKTLSTRIDSIILYINNLTKHIGQYVKFSLNLIQSVLFIDRYEEKSNSTFRNGEECEEEIEFILEYLEKNELISRKNGSCEEDYCEIKLLPVGYKRVDELQKYRSYGKMC